MKNKKLKIFISHAWADKEFSTFKVIKNALQDHYDVWIDVKGIDYGESINDKLVQAIRESDVVLVLWSKAAEQSEAVQFEIQTALEFNKSVVPCLISDYGLEHSQQLKGKLFIDFYHDAKTIRGVDRGLTNLTQSLFRREVDSPKFKAMKNQVSLLDKALQELVDLLSRMEQGVSGNEHGNVYIQSAIEPVKNLISGSQKSFSSKQKLIRFLERSQEISAQYPNPNQNHIKLKLLIQAIDEIDPDGTEPNMQTCKQNCLINLT